VARVSQVKLHVPIKNNDLDINNNKITVYLEHEHNVILNPKPYRAIAKTTQIG
jgi:translation initiation factor IF-3